MWWKQRRTLYPACPNTFFPDMSVWCLMLYFPLSPNKLLTQVYIQTELKGSKSLTLIYYALGENILNTICSCNLRQQILCEASLSIKTKEIHKRHQFFGAAQDPTRYYCCCVYRRRMLRFNSCVILCLWLRSPNSSNCQCFTWGGPGLV